MLHKILYLWDPPCMIGMLYIPIGNYIIKTKIPHIGVRAHSHMRGRIHALDA